MHQKSSLKTRHAELTELFFPSVEKGCAFLKVIRYRGRSFYLRYSRLLSLSHPQSPENSNRSLINPTNQLSLTLPYALILLILLSILHPYAELIYSHHDE